MLQTFKVSPVWTPRGEQVSHRARGVTSGATRGDENEPDSFEVDCGDVEPDFYAQSRGFASHLAGLRASLGGEVNDAADPRE